MLSYDYDGEPYIQCVTSDIYSPHSYVDYTVGNGSYDFDYIEAVESVLHNRSECVIKSSALS